jgi:HK97 family phage major capsid protein
VRTLEEITRDKTAAEDKKTALAAETREITTRLHAESRPAGAGEQERLARLERGYAKADAEITTLDNEQRDTLAARYEMLVRNSQNPNLVEGPEPSRPNRTADTRPAEGRPERDAAHRAIDQAERSGDLPTEAAGRAERLLSAGTPRDQSIAARWAATTGDPAYTRAFLALMADPARGHLLWTPAEADAYRKAAAVQSEMRAYGSLTDNVGGFMVPLFLDPAIILSGAGTTNTMRKVSRVVQTVSEAWQGVTSAGVTAEWIAENQQVAEATPTLAAVPIPVYKGDAFVPYSFEIGMDGVNFVQELQLALVDAADTLMATAYTVGSGSGQATGVVQALLGGASKINGLSSEAIASELRPLILEAHIAIINGYAQMESAAGARLFPEIKDGRLLNKPLNENSDMDGVIVPAATADNYVLVYGDFSQYIIVDRIGTTLEIIPNLMGAGYRPTGSRGALLWFRTGGNVGTINAFRLLDIPTTA